MIDYSKMKLEDVRDIGLIFDGRKVQYLVYGNNPCCKDKPLVIVENPDGSLAGLCECGYYCTTSYKTAADVIRDYFSMKVKS